MARYWYTYKGTAFDPELPSSYRRTTVVPGDSACFVGTFICAISAPSGNITPDSPFSANILQYINDALASTGPQPQKGKVYLYKKIL